MLQNPRKTLGFKKNMVYEIPPRGEVNHIQPVAYNTSYGLGGRYIYSQNRMKHCSVFSMLCTYKIKDATSNA